MVVTGFQLVTGIHPSELRLDMTLSRSGTATKRTAAEFMARRDAEYAINGPMWESGSRPGALYFDAINNVSFDGAWSDSHGATISVVNGRALQTPGQSKQPHATFALQGYPELIRNGQSVVDRAKNRDYRWRVGIGIMPDGLLCFAIGRGSMEAFANELLKADVIDAIYTDGGGSAKLIEPDNTIKGDPLNRPVASWVYVPRRTPAVPRGGVGSTGGGMGTVVLGVILSYLVSRYL